MFRIFIFLLILSFILSGLIFVNWEVIKKINKSIIISIIAAFLAVLVLIIFVKNQDNEKYKKGHYKPAHFENGVLKKEEIE